jgi:hypothetical protein
VDRAVGDESLRSAARAIESFEQRKMSREEDGAVLSKGCNAFDSWMPFDKVAMSERVVMFKSGEETMPKGSARGITGMWQSNDQRGDIGSVQESRVEKSQLPASRLEN